METHRDVSAAACAYLLAVAQRYFDTFVSATAASPLVVIEHTRYIEEHPDWPAYMRDVDLPKFVSYVLYRTEIPRATLVTRAVCGFR